MLEDGRSEARRRDFEAGRSPVVITERKEHVATLAERLSKFAKNVVVLRGGMSARQARAAALSLAGIPEGEERVLVATGRYLGEGFDEFEHFGAFGAAFGRGRHREWSNVGLRLVPVRREAVVASLHGQFLPMFDAHLGAFAEGEGIECVDAVKRDTG